MAGARRRVSVRDQRTLKHGALPCKTETNTSACLRPDICFINRFAFADVQHERRLGRPAAARRDTPDAAAGRDAVVSCVRRALRLGRRAERTLARVAVRPEPSARLHSRTGTTRRCYVGIPPTC